MGVAQALVAFAAAYLAGSVPVGVLYLRISETSIQRSRTGNIGASEAREHLGLRAAAVVGLGIFLQGLLPPLVARLLTDSATPVAAAAVGTVVGYGWQLLPRLGGGRGVGVSTGAAAVISPAALIPLFAAYALGGLARQMGLATLVGFVAYAVSVAYLTGSLALRTAAFAILLLLVVRRLEGVRDDLEQGPALRIVADRLLFDRRPEPHRRAG